MEILKNFNDDTFELIADSQSYVLPEALGFGDGYGAIIKLSVFSNGSFQGDYQLEQNKDFYIKNEQLFLKPNEVLDRNNFSEGNYSLQFDFLKRYDQQDLYVAEVSPSRKEIRLRYQNVNDNELPKVNEDTLTGFLNEDFTNLSPDNYKFNSFLELTQGLLIPINNYAFDTTTNGEDGKSVILKLNTAVPGNVVRLFTNFKIVNKWLASQTQDIFFIDREGLAASGFGLEIDEGYINDSVEVTDDVRTYNSLTSSIGTSLIEDFNRNKKDINLNIDYSKFENHTFFGSAKLKLQNFKDKAIRLEGLYKKLSDSLSIESTAKTIERRKDLFKSINKIKDEFTKYENFLYTDNQSFSTASAPGIGFNLAGNNFANNSVGLEANTLEMLQNQEGFERVYKKTSTGNILHLFTDVYNVELSPFFNTDNDVYLSFVAKGFSGSSESSNLAEFKVDGGDSNVSFGINRYQEYNYGRTRRIPFEAFSGSVLLNPESTGSHYQRYIFRGKQNNWRPVEESPINNDIFNQDLSDLTRWSGSNHTYYQVLSSSNQVISASISGSVGDGYAYGIRDSSGQHTPFMFPSYLDSEGLGQTFTFNTASILPQGDLFPIYVNNSDVGATVHFTDVKVSYNNPTNIHPFSNINRPPSGSYDGSDEWNNWYNTLITKAEQYDDDNIHSLVNNLPLSLRTDGDHEILRKFVNMIAEEFDLLRNYIDNYHNFYKLGYKNPNSMPDNLLPILGDTLGWKLLSPITGSSFNEYVSSNTGDNSGIQGNINLTWKKILNNLMYVYKSKGTVESIASLLNLYGLDGSSFGMQEYGGSIAEHNPTIIKNDSSNFEEGMKNIKGNVSFVKESKPFLMTSFTGNTSLGIDWWRNDADANGVEFLFNSQNSFSPQTILRSSGSNDLWDLRLVPSGSSNKTAKLEFRINYEKNASSAIGANHVSMSTDFNEKYFSGDIWNVMVQRSVVTASNSYGDMNFTQSYNMFVARKDDDKIQDVQFISMSSHDVLSVSASSINQNFITSSNFDNNLIIGETFSGSVAEVRVWEAFVSMSKFKQHVINYESTVGNKITSSVDELIYRFPLNEGIIDFASTEGSASLKINDANPSKKKDYSITISSQPNFKPKSTITEKTFYKLTVKGTDQMPNDNQTNLAPKMTSVGQLSADKDNVSEPTDATGQTERVFSNKFGRNISYVNAIDSLIMNQMPDFRIDDFIGDPDEDLTETYEDLLRLRKSLIGDTKVSVDVTSNLRAAETVMDNSIVQNIGDMTPAKTKMDFSYEIKNDTLFRSKTGTRTQVQTKLNPNKVIGNIDADKWDEPTIVSTANEKFKKAVINADEFDEPTVTSFANNNFKTAVIDASQWDEPTLSGINPQIQGGTSIQFVRLDDSIRNKVFNVTLEEMNEFFLGGKNDIAKNYGTASHNRHIISPNQGVFGDYNTYKFENRFTFNLIGDTEVFRGSASIHDNFKDFENRFFVDKNHPSNFKYKSFFGVGSENGALKDGRMVGRTRFFLQNSDGSITYPSNHYITARTSKDVLNNLIYKGTQHIGKNPTRDPIGNDPFPNSPAYIIDVGGSDTVTRIRVDRPVSRDLRNITLNIMGRSGEVTFTLLKGRETVITQNLHSTGDTAPREITVSFAQTGEPSGYGFTVTPTGTSRVRGVRVIPVNDRRNASINANRNRDNGVDGRFTAIRGDFALRIDLV